MATKSNKEPKSTKKPVAKNTEEKERKAFSRSKKEPENDDEDNIEDTEDVTTKKAGAKPSAKSVKEENDEEDDLEEDDWNKAEEDNWDPDFEEFDLPKSKAAKGGISKKGTAGDDDDFKIDDEFKDLFSSKNKFDSDDEDDF